MDLTEQHIREMIDPEHEEFVPEMAELFNEIGSEIWTWFDKEADPGTINALVCRILVTIHDKVNKQ